MRVLHAYICEEYYSNWATEQRKSSLPESKDTFLRQFGTPLIVFDTQEKSEFYPVLEGGMIRINSNYHMDCRLYRTTLPESQPSEQLATVLETVLQSPSVTSIRSRILRWLGM